MKANHLHGSEICGAYTPNKNILTSDDDKKSTKGEEDDGPMGTYYYVIDLQDGENVYKGTVTIIL